MLRTDKTVRFFNLKGDPIGEQFVESIDPTVVDLPLETAVFCFYLIVSQEVECDGMTLTLDAERQISPDYLVGWRILTRDELADFLETEWNSLSEEARENVREEALEHALETKFCIYASQDGKHLAFRPYDPEEDICVSARAFLG